MDKFKQIFEYHDAISELESNIMRATAVKDIDLVKKLEIELLSKMKQLSKLL